MLGNSENKSWMLIDTMIMSIPKASILSNNEAASNLMTTLWWVLKSRLAICDFVPNNFLF